MYWTVELDLPRSSEKAIEDIVQRVIENCPSDPSPRRVEKSTAQVVANHDFLRTGTMDNHIKTINAISKHTYIEIDKVSKDTEPQIIQEKTRKALVDYAKRESLHEIRRIFYGVKETPGDGNTFGQFR